MLTVWYSATAGEKDAWEHYRQSGKMGDSPLALTPPSCVGQHNEQDVA